VKKEKKKKEEFVDDGRVIANMDSEYINGYKSKEHHEQRRALRETNLNRKERWAIYKGLLANVMPILLTFVAALLLGIALLDLLWIK